MRTTRRDDDAKRIEPLDAPGVSAALPVGNRLPPRRPTSTEGARIRRLSFIARRCRLRDAVPPDGMTQRPSVSVATRRFSLLLGALLSLCSSTSRAQMGPPQDVSGAGSPAPAPTMSAAPSPSPGGGANRSAAAPQGGTSSPDQLLGLVRIDEPPVISLGEALQFVADKSFDLRIAAEEVTQANLQVRKAWALLLPQVSLGGTYSFNFPEQTVEFGSPSQNGQQALLFRSLADVVSSSAQFSQDPAERAAALQQAEQLRQAAQDIESSKPVEVVVQPAHMVSGQLQVSVPLFSGRATPLLQNAYEAVDISEAVVVQARAALLLAATRAYYGAVSAKKLMAIAREQQTSAERHRDALRQREALGLATAIALQRADLDVIRAEQQARAAHQGYAMTLGALGQLMAREELFEVESPPEVPQVEQLDTPEGMIERALQARPEIAVRRSALAIAQRMRTDAWMAFLPSLTLVGQGRYTSNTSGFAAEPITGAVMLQANIPIYDGGTRYATLKETASKIVQEELRLEQEERRIRSQVRGNLDDITLKRQALETADKGLALAVETRDNAQRLFDLGVATSLDVIDANLAVFFAQVEQTRAQLEVEQARLGLAFVSGALTPSLVLAREHPRAYVSN